MKAGILVAQVAGKWTASADLSRTLRTAKVGIIMATATFGAGCFWGVEAAFREVSGVVSTAVGYAGGTTPHPTYEEVCSGKTGHTEVVEVVYDAATVTYEELLHVFWRIHDPAQAMKAQYKSVIFFYTPEQRATAEAVKARLQRAGTFTRPLLTEIRPAPVFHLAEGYHQQYYEKRGFAGRLCGVG